MESAGRCQKPQGDDDKKDRTQSMSTADSADEVDSRPPSMSSADGAQECSADSLPSRAKSNRKSAQKLQSPWCIWARGQQGCTMMVRKFTTLDECQKLFSDLRGPYGVVQDMLAGDAFSGDGGALEVLVFKESVIPAEEACDGAGQWIADTSSMPSTVFNELWLNLIMAVVMAVDMGGHLILGAVACCHEEQSRMTLWVSACTEHEVMATGQAFHNLLGNFGFADRITFSEFGAASLGAPSLVLGGAPKAITTAITTTAASIQQATQATPGASSLLLGALSAVEREAREEASGKLHSRSPYIAGRGRTAVGESSTLTVELPSCGVAKPYRVNVKNTFIDVILPVEMPDGSPVTCRPWRSGSI